jgi:hypothetical protein
MIASLACVIPQRSVSKGLRPTLLTEAKRLGLLADERFGQIAEEIPVEQEGRDRRRRG